MNSVVYDNVLAVGYLLLWVITFVWYQTRNRHFDSGSCIIAFYIFYAIISISTLNDDLFSMVYLPLKIVPYLYLYAMMMIALTPMIVLHNNKDVDTIEDPHTRILYIIGIIVIICGLLQIPFMLGDINMNLMQLFIDVDAGKEQYLEQVEDTRYSGYSISNLFSIVYNALYDLSIFIFFYLLTLTKKNRLFFFIFLGVLILGLILPALSGQRTAIICGIQAFLVGYLLFRRFLSKHLTKVINIVGISLIVVIMLPVMAITISRFGDRGIMRFVNWYLGQGSLYFNNYALDPGGTRHGDRTLNMFKRLVSSDTPNNYVERREKYGHLEIDDYYFTTFVGDFVIDFGPYIAVLLFIIFYGFILYNIRPRGKIIKLHQLLLVYYSACVSIQGGMYLFAYSDTGNLKIIATFIFYAYLVYHEKLIEKYPLPPMVESKTDTTI